MDPLTALGIAGNIIAFIDFAWTITTEARTIYKSGGASTSDSARFLDVILSDVERLDIAIARGPVASRDLELLVEKSGQIAAELRAGISTARKHGRSSKWDSLSAALKEVWGRDRTEGLVKMLLDLQGRINSHLLYATTDKLSRLSDTLATFQRTNEMHHIISRNNVEQLRWELIHAIKAASEEAERTKLEIEKQSPGGHHGGNTAPRAPEAAEPRHLRRLHDATKNLTDAAAAEAAYHRTLSCFHFPSIATRHQAIDSAHAETFRWIFTDHIPGPRPQPVRFREWLENESGIFWIQGKPGSGKSTLMKFLCKEQLTFSHLGVWSGTKRLAVAKFFFWHSGTPLQKTQEGLLQSIIYELLRQAPELLPPAQALVDSMYGASLNLVSLDELLGVYHAMVSLDELPMKFCLFIDGLDEFHHDTQTHTDLLHTLRSMRHSPDIKLCVSSRPWTVFEDEFRDTSWWSLKLEDLTAGDIRRYVDDKFRQHSQFKALCARDENYALLVREVTERAQGVFLWVFLVVRELLDGLTYHDPIPTLRLRLGTFPPTLDAYFQRLVDLVAPVYRSQLARMFAITTMTGEPVLAMFYSILDDVEQDPGFPLRVAPSQIDEVQVAERLDRVRRRLDGRTRGLFEVSERRCYWSETFTRFWADTVDVIHRAVRDFIHESPHVRNFMMEQLAGDKVSERCARAALAHIKANPVNIMDATWLEYHLNCIFFFVSKAMDEGVPQGHLADIVEDAEGCLMHAGMDGQETLGVLLERAATAGLLAYLQRKLKLPSPGRVRKAGGARGGTPAFNHVHLLSFIDGCGRWLPPRLSCDVVEHLLRCGEDPNAHLGDNTVFAGFICFLVVCAQGSQRDEAVRIARLLVLHGANLEELVMPVDSSPAMDPKGEYCPFFPSVVGERDSTMGRGQRAGAYGLRQAAQAVSVLEMVLTRVEFDFVCGAQMPSVWEWKNRGVRKRLMSERTGSRTVQGDEDAPRGIIGAPRRERWPLPMLWREFLWGGFN